MIKFIVALLTVFTLTTSTALAADVLQPACSQAPTSSICEDHAAQNGSNTNPVNHIVQVAANIVAAIAGTVAIIMIIFSAFRFASGGSSESVNKARNTLLWAVVGLAVVGLAWTIITFAIDKLIQN